LTSPGVHTQAAVVLLLESPVLLTTPVVPSVLLADTGPLLPLLVPLLPGSLVTPLLVPPSVTPLASVVLVAELVVGAEAFPEEEEDTVVRPLVSGRVTPDVSVSTRLPSSEQAVTSTSAAKRDKGCDFIASSGPSRARDASAVHRPGRVNMCGHRPTARISRRTPTFAVSPDAVTGD